MTIMKNKKIKADYLYTGHNCNVYMHRFHGSFAILPNMFPEGKKGERNYSVKHNSNGYSFMPFFVFQNQRSQKECEP